MHIGFSPGPVADVFPQSEGDSALSEFLFLAGVKAFNPDFSRRHGEVSVVDETLVDATYGQFHISYGLAIGLPPAQRDSH